LHRCRARVAWRGRWPRAVRRLHTWGQDEVLCVSKGGLESSWPALGALASAGRRAKREWGLMRKLCAVPETGAACEAGLGRRHTARRTAGVVCAGLLMYVRAKVPARVDLGKLKRRIFLS
jgi:hypothetical protein